MMPIFGVIVLALAFFGTIGEASLLHYLPRDFSECLLRDPWIGIFIIVSMVINGTAVAWLLSKFQPSK